MPSNTQELLKEINASLTTLEAKIEVTESKAYNIILKQIKGLEYSNAGTLIQNTHNTRILGDMKRELDKLLRSPGYKNAIIKFGASFDVVEKIQNQWFSAMVDDFKPKGAIITAKRTAVKQMVDNLVGGGVKQAVTERAGNILLRQMQSGASIRTVNDELRNFILTDKNSAGALKSYSGQIATDSLNQYTAAYNLQVTEDLGFEWYQYVGRIKDTSREWCVFAVKQRYFHKSELSKAARGDFRTKKNVSLAGLYPNTDGSNVLTLRGGFRCNHQFRGVSSKNVPLSIRALFSSTK